jgi:hypothetical protein
MHVFIIFLERYECQLEDIRMGNRDAMSSLLQSMYQYIAYVSVLSLLAILLLSQNIDANLDNIINTYICTCTG